MSGDPKSTAFKLQKKLLAALSKLKICGFFWFCSPFLYPSTTDILHITSQILLSFNKVFIKELNESSETQIFTELWGVLKCLLIVLTIASRILITLRRLVKVGNLYWWTSYGCTEVSFKFTNSGRGMRVMIMKHRLSFQHWIRFRGDLVLKLEILRRWNLCAKSSYNPSPNLLRCIWMILWKGVEKNFNSSSNKMENALPVQI